MARPKHPSEDRPCTASADPLTKDGDTPPMAEAQHTNGILHDHDQLSVSKAIASKKVFTWAKSNAFAIIGIAIAAGALWILPVTRWQLDDVTKDLKSQIGTVSTRVEGHDKDIAEIKSGLTRVEDNTTKILLKLTPERYSKDPAPIPASSPHPEKPHPKAKDPIQKLKDLILKE